jgi:hypothetical protein
MTPSPKVAALLCEPLSLPERDRLDLAAALIGSVDNDGVRGYVDAAWVSEARRRLAEVQSGVSVMTIDVDAVYEDGVLKPERQPHFPSAHDRVESPRGGGGPTQMTKRPVAHASRKPKRQTLAEALEYVKTKRANIVYREGRRPYAVLVPVDDEGTVEAIEDVIDARAAERVLAKMKRTGEKPVPYEKFRKELLK